MQLIFQLSFCSFLFNKFPSHLQFLSCTRLKTLRIMEDKVASIVCNLMLNVMYTSLSSLNMFDYASLLNLPQLMESNESWKVLFDYL